MPLGTEVGLFPGDIVLDGDPAPPKRSTAPNFQSMSIVAKRLDASGSGTEVGLGPGDIFDGVPAPPAERSRAAPPIFSAHVYCSQMVAHFSNC